MIRLPVGHGRRCGAPVCRRTFWELAPLPPSGTVLGRLRAGAAGEPRTPRLGTSDMPGWNISRHSNRPLAVGSRQSSVGLGFSSELRPSGALAEPSRVRIVETSFRVLEVHATVYVPNLHRDLQISYVARWRETFAQDS